MTIQTAVHKARFVGNGVNTTFPFSFKTFQTTDLQLTQTSVAGVDSPVTSLFSISLNSDQEGSPGGVIAYPTSGSPLANGIVLTVVSVLAETQLTDLTNAGGFFPKTITDRFDYLTILIQQHSEKLARVAFGSVSDNAPNLSIGTALQRASKYLTFDGSGNVALAASLPSGTLSRASIGALSNPVTSVEGAALVVPIDTSYPFGDLRRYGGDPTGAADSSAALQSAASCGYILIPQGCTFKILTGATRTGPVTMLGMGATSTLLCDGTVLTVNAGTGSVVDNFTMLNITAPWVISRNPNNWAAVIGAATQSNTVLGYQPTVNDPEYATLVAGNPAIGTQNIGPQIIFQGNASNIDVSRVYGRFVCITLYDTQYSSVHDCDFRGGKNFAGIAFWNNNAQVGEGNKAYANRVIYASFDGVLMSRNYDFTITDNTCLLNGESGVKTNQDTTGVVGCYKGLIADNICNYNYFDGVDAMSIGGGTPTPVTRYLKVTGNYCFQNGGDGMNVDGQLNQIDSNWLGFNWRYGIWAAGPAGLAFSSVRNNHFYDNNQARISTQHDLGITGVAGYAAAYSAGQGYAPGAYVVNAGVAYRCLQPTTGNAPPNPIFWVVATPGGNHIDGNYVYAGAGQNNFGIYAPDTNFIGDNCLANGATHFYGNAGAISSVVEDVVDGLTGMLANQCFNIQILNTAGTMQHSISSDNATFGQNLISSRVIGAINANQNTPTGADSTTAFGFGAKIGSANTNLLILNTLPQAYQYFDMVPVITFNSTGTSLCCSLNLTSINVNGVSYPRPNLSFTVNGTGAAFALTPANIAAGKLISVVLKGKLA